MKKPKKPKLKTLEKFGLPVKKIKCGKYQYLAVKMDSFLEVLRRKNLVRRSGISGGYMMTLYRGSEYIEAEMANGMLEAARKPRRKNEGGE